MKKTLQLPHNSKVYESKELALQAFTEGTNDGSPKLSRYVDKDGKIKTLVGFYADASAMTYSSSGESYYTVFDVDGMSGDTSNLQEQIDEINESIGGNFDSGHTVADAISDAVLFPSNSISIVSNTVRCIVANDSGEGIQNPIIIGNDGIKFTTLLDCGYWD